MKEKEQSLIHVKIDYMEAVQSKKDLLASERDFIRILKIIKKYSLLRKEELTLRLRMQSKIKALKINLGRLSEILPKVKIPSILKKNEIEEEKPLKIKQEAKDKDLESQLREIQERLRKLE
jgi:hypothetical protein